MEITVDAHRGDTEPAEIHGTNMTPYGSTASVRLRDLRVSVVCVDHDLRTLRAREEIIRP
jgi:hypothetical protein